MAIFIGTGTVAQAAEPPVRVFAAISLSESLTEAAKGFEAKTHIPVVLNLGASGQLAAQIEQGAPADVFIPAAAKQMEPLVKIGLIQPADISIIAHNRMVLVCPKDADFSPDGFQALSDSRVTRIAIGEPRTVPAGQYAMEILKSLGLMDLVKGKLVYAANVRQVLDYVERGEVDAGLVYQSDAMTSDQVRVVAVALSTWHTPIEYPAGALKNSDRKGQAETFIQWLAGPDGQKILQKHGFGDAGPTSRPADQ
ncbi:MAG: molybdate ABC transporter substrate-binding protein [Phycisphaerales bacterium]|nr:molybdate ABC transporter substrate-binding protein [Phycisphaerales bacterium]